MSRKSMALSVIVVVIILIVSSVVYVMITGTSGDRKSEIEASLSISEPPPLNTTAEVTFTFSSLVNLTNTSNLRAEIVFPSVYGDGFEWVGEQPKWKGSLMKGDEIEINGTIKSTKKGNWTVAAALFFAQNENYTLAWDANYDGDISPRLNESENVSSVWYKLLYISVSDQDAYISDDPFPEYKTESEEYLETEIGP